MCPQVTLNQIAARLSAPPPRLPDVPTAYTRVDIGSEDAIYATPDQSFERVEFLSSTGERATGDLGGIDFRSPHMEQVNCVVHDVKNSAWTKTAIGGLRDACHFYNNGWNSNLGHAMYDQHDSDDETRLYRNCIIGQNFAYGLHAFGTNTNIRNLRFERCIFHDSPALVGGAACWNIEFDECLFWNAPIQLGYGSVLHHDITMTNCYAAQSPLWAKNTERLTVVGSDFHSDASPLRYETAFGQLETDMRGNRYGGRDYFRAIGLMHGGKPFAEYQQATGFDADSSFTPGLPTDNQVFVYPCSTRPKVAHIAVYNWQELEQVTVSLSGLLMENGRSYRLRSAYDPYGDMTLFTYDGSGRLTLSFAGRTVALPIGWLLPLATLDPRFGVFILEEV